MERPIHEPGSNAMALGFGIVGCGMISHFHARAIGDCRGAKLVAGFDTHLPAAEKLSEAFGCAAYDDLDAMLADPAVDVVTIATPSGAHMEPAVAAARAGKHVIVEKPLEVNLRRCDRIIAECEKAGVVLSTIFPSRFHHSSQEIKRAIDKGRFGQMIAGDAFVKWYRSQEYYDSGAWRGTWKLDGGGALMNQAIHSVDLICWLMGPVREIRARMGMLAHERIEVEDIVMATIEYESGAMGVIEASTAMYPGYLKRIEVHGSTGSVLMEEEDLKAWDFAKVQRRDEQIIADMKKQRSGGGGAADPAAIGHHGHTSQFKDVIKAIQKGTKPLVDGPEGRRSVEVILGIYKAAETGRAVPLPLKSDPKLKSHKLGVAGAMAE
jgi:predicted dehydrogenase